MSKYKSFNPKRFPFPCSKGKFTKISQALNSFLKLVFFKLTPTKSLVNKNNKCRTMEWVFYYFRDPLRISLDTKSKRHLLLTPNLKIHCFLKPFNFKVNYFRNYVTPLSLDCLLLFRGRRTDISIWIFQNGEGMQV